MFLFVYIFHIWNLRETPCIHVPNTSGDPSQHEDMTKHDKNKFKAADENGDDKLSKTEFPYFMYPEQHQFMANHVVGVSNAPCVM